MTRKKTPQAKRPKQKPKTPKKPTPFADVGSIVGSSVGQMFNQPKLKGFGRWLGSGIGSIFGSGDYTLVGAPPKYNVLTNPAQIPKFDTLRATNLVSHREYIGDVVGTAGFNLTSYPLNPGLTTTFPWLSTVAQNYQEYKWHGVVFEFRPLITDFITGGAPGVVVMATNYNAAAASFTSKQEMENSEFAVSVKPTCALMHGVECADNQTVMDKAYVRTGSPPVGQDLRLYDLGNFQFATQANPVQSLGELWVSYTVELFKPILPSDVGGDVESQVTERSNVSAAAPLGTVSTYSSGDLVGFVVTPTTISWYAYPGNSYLVNTSWGGAATVITFPLRTLVGLAAKNILNARSTNTAFAPNGGVLSTSCQLNDYYNCNLLNPGVVTVTYSGTGVTPVVFVDLVVTQISDAMV